MFESEKLDAAIEALKNEPTDEHIRRILAILLDVEDNEPCDQCHNSGRFWMTSWVDPEGSSEPCRKCLGTGRLIDWEKESKT